MGCSLIKVSHQLNNGGQSVLLKLNGHFTLAWRLVSRTAVCCESKLFKVLMQDIHVLVVGTDRDAQRPRWISGCAVLQQ